MLLFLSPCIYLASKLYYLAAYLLCLAIYQLPSPARAPSFLSSLFPGGLPFVIDPCPGCLGIDWLSPCHWSSLSILTRFGHPLRCGQRVGERGRYIRCSTALGDEIKMNERERKTKRDGEENDGGRECVKQLVSTLMRLLHLSRAFLVFGMWSFTVYELMNSGTPLVSDTWHIMTYDNVV